MGKNLLGRIIEIQNQLKALKIRTYYYSKRHRGHKKSMVYANRIRRRAHQKSNI